MSDSNLPENVLDTLFDWDGVLDKVDAMNEGTCTTRREKQLVILVYSFELAYDLCLSPLWNVWRILVSNHDYIYLTTLRTNSK